MSSRVSVAAEAAATKIEPVFHWVLTGRVRRALVREGFSGADDLSLESAAEHFASVYADLPDLDILSRRK